MLKKFYLQNCLSTVLVLVAAVAAYFSLEGLAQNPQPLLATSEVPAREQVKFLPGDERSGLPDRQLFLAADGTKTKLQAMFRNGPTVDVKYDTIGRPIAAEETNPDGSSMRFVLKSNLGKPQLQQLLVFDKEKALRREINLGNESFELKHFAADGKTLVCVQKLDKSKKSSNVTVYYADGKTPRAVKTADATGTLVRLYSDKGILCEEQKSVLVSGKKNSKLSGKSIVTTTVYREDGQTVWFTRNGDSQLPCEESPPFKWTYLRQMFRLLPFFWNFKTEEKEPQAEVAFVVEIYGKNGVATQRLHLGEDKSLIKAESLAKDGKKILSTKSYKPGEEFVQDEIKDVVARCNLKSSYRGLRDFLLVRLRLEPNHLRQTFAGLQ